MPASVAFARSVTISPNTFFSTSSSRNVLPVPCGAVSHSMGRNGSAPPMMLVTTHPRNAAPCSFFLPPIPHHRFV